MQVLLCKKSLLRLGASPDELLAQLRDREHTPVARECLDRCGPCQQGGVIASVDGMPVRAASVAAFLGEVDALAADADE